MLISIFICFNLLVLFFVGDSEVFLRTKKKFCGAPYRLYEIWIASQRTSETYLMMKVAQKNEKLKITY